MAKAKGAAAQRRPRSSRGAGGGGPRHRTAMAELDVDYGCEDNYLFSELGNVRTLGIFIRTLTPRPIGSFLLLRFAPGLATAGASSSGVIRLDRRVEAMIKATPMNMHRLSLDEPLPPGTIAGSGQHRLTDVGDDLGEGPGDELGGAVESSIDEPLEDSGATITQELAELAELTDDGPGDELDPDLEAELAAELGAAPLPELKIEGEIVWVNPYRPSVKDNLHPGMGIRFIGLDAITRRRLLALVGRVAYL
jgi:hypothetical protein